MIHRFEVNPPQDFVLIFAHERREDRNRPEGTMFELDGYVKTRMVGGRNEFGELLPPCLITVDDGTERGRWELEQIHARLAADRLPGVTRYAPPTLGISDDQIEALVARRLEEELRKRGYVERPSEEMREALGMEEEEEIESYPEFSGLTPTRVEIVQAPDSIRIERTRDGRLRCPLDRRLFKEGTPWNAHWTRNLDPKHQEMAQTMVESVAVA